MAAALAAKLDPLLRRAGAISGNTEWTARDAAAREFVVSVGDAQIDVTDATFAGGAITANIAGAFYGAKIRHGSLAIALCASPRGRSAPCGSQITRKHGGSEVIHGGARVLVTVRSRHAAELAALMPAKVAADTSKYLLCPMPGLVVSINVSEGQAVEAGETLAVVEAMKMENVLT